jgi:peptide-methionine (S)-S-oxide reductase
MSVHALSLTATPFISSALASQTRRINLARSLKQEVVLVSHFFDCKEFHTRAAADLHRSVFTTRSFVVASSPARAMEKGRSFLSMLGFGGRGSSAAQTDPTTAGIPHGPDDDAPAPGQQFAAFGAGCFWGVELAYQRVPGVTKTEVGYSQGFTHKPSYNDVCSGTTGHSEIVRVEFDPKECSYQNLLDVFWKRHDPTTLNRQGGDVGTQYRSGIYYYSPEQEEAAKESLEKHQKSLNRKIVSEVLPAKKFYRAEEYHQQYLSKGGRFGSGQSTEKGCTDPIRCYG